jgi:transposase
MFNRNAGPSMAVDLERLLRSGKTEQRLAQRCRIVLLWQQGRSIHGVAAELGIGRNIVRRWCRRFAANGVAGLCDLPRSGRPRKRAS